MSKNLFWLLLVCCALCFTGNVFSLNTWPSSTWNNAVNISSALPTSAQELSGMYWNDQLACLYAVGDGGIVYLLELNKNTNTFSMTGSATGIGGPEGITQVGNAKNEFYTIDENSYEIRKYNFKTNYNGVTQLKSWKLTQSPSPMNDTGNAGPEGIAFVPDSYLQRIGFISSKTGITYTSTKGMGGLMFVAHQDGGYIWVFDVNPNVSNDFAYVGKYKTNRTESCDLSFDYSVGLLYILHNLDDNYLEVSNLQTTKSSSEYKLNTVAEYPIPNPSGSINIEGVAVSPKYTQNNSVGVWLCRDVTKTDEVTDALRWFKTFVGEGTEIGTGVGTSTYGLNRVEYYFDKSNNNLLITNDIVDDFHFAMFDIQGRLCKSGQHLASNQPIKCSDLSNGIYLIKSTFKNRSEVFKLIIFPSIAK